MFIRNYTGGIIHDEDWFTVTVLMDCPGNDHAPVENGSGYEYLASEECINKMRQPVVCNGREILNTAAARKFIVDLSWYFETPEVERKEPWGEAAIRKMREPTGHGHPSLLPLSSLEKLMSLI